MANRHFPVRPNLDQLRHQAKDLLHAIRRSDPDAMVDFREHHPKSIDPATVRLADAQFVLARSYGLTNWTRLVTACRMTDAIWRGDVETVRAMVLRDPHLLDEDARDVVTETGVNPVTAYLFTLSSLDSLTDRLLARLQGERLWRSQWASSLICCNR
jgi:hypothetical protein